MKRVAIVVQRCHESVVGGSESLAWNYATLLRDTCDVDVLCVDCCRERFNRSEMKPADVFGLA